MKKPQVIEDPIIQRLDVIIRLQAIALISDIKTQKDKILFLDKAGLTPKQISELLVTSANNVSVAIYSAKKAAEKVTKATVGVPNGSGE